MIGFWILILSCKILSIDYIVWDYDFSEKLSYLIVYYYMVIKFLNNNSTKSSTRQIESWVFISIKTILI